MSEGQRALTHAHYIARWYDPETWRRLARPTKQRVMAQRLGLSLSEYYTRRDVAKSCIRVVLTLDSKVLSLAPAFLVASAKAEQYPSGR
jgi:hypothetical protein